MVLDDKALQLTASSDELCHITLVKEWAKNHPNVVLSKALLGEENIMAYLPLLSYTVFSNHTIPMRSPATPVRKHSLSPPPLMGKGKKPRRERAKANSSPKPPSQFLSGLSSKVVEVR